VPRKKVEILYADDDIIVVNKPAGVSVTKDRTGAQQLVDILSEQLSPQVSSKLRLVHRLDKDTSGAMILARNKESQSRFSSYFEKRLIKKTYLALVTGLVSAPEGTIDARLAPDSRNPYLMEDLESDRKRRSALVGALNPPATKIKGNKQVVIPILPENKGCFHRSLTCLLFVCINVPGPG